MAEPVDHPNAREVYCPGCHEWSDRGAWGTTQKLPEGGEPDWAKIGDPLTLDRLEADVAESLVAHIVCPLCGHALNLTGHVHERPIALVGGGVLPSAVALTPEELAVRVESEGG